MQRFIAIAAILVIALSTGLVGMADANRGATGDMPAAAMVSAHMADASMSGHAHDHGEGTHDRAGYHTSCAIAGHSCAGYVTPELEAVAGLAYTRQDWSAPAPPRAAGLSPEATTPPPRA